MTCYEEIDRIFVVIHSGHCPNVEAISKKLAQEVRGVRENQMKQYAQNVIQPGLDYFESQMEGSLKGALEAFKSVRLFSPHKAHTMKPVALDVDSLKSFPFFDDNTLKEMKEELPTYLAKCADTDESFCPVTWWKQNSDQLPVWAAAFRKCSLFSQVLLLLSMFFLCSVLPSMTKITHCKTTLRPNASV